MLRSGRSRFNLQCAAGNRSSRSRRRRSDAQILAAAADLSDLKKLIDKTQFAISTEETRYYLNGIFLHTAEVDGHTMLRAVATDGHRLARVEMPGARRRGRQCRASSCRARRSAEVQKLVEDVGAESRRRDVAAKARFTFGDVVLTSKLIDGTFPDYARVIPDRQRQTARRRAQGPFAAAVDRVSTISSERGRAVKLAIGDGKLMLSVNNPNSGSATEELEVDYDSTPIEIGFNARYLLDIAGQLSGDTALLKLADPGSPTIVQDRDGAAALYVLMPMRV